MGGWQHPPMPLDVRSLKPTARRRWRLRNGLIVPTAEAVAEALATVPPGTPWAWAALRLLPAVRGERVQVLSDDEIEEIGFRPLSDFPTVNLPPGLDISIVIDIGPASVTVDQEQLDRWEMRIEDLLPPAMANLRRAIGTSRAEVYEDSYEGVPTRALRGWPQWAGSLLVCADELMRLFGHHDQLFIVPYACNLVSLPADVDRDIAADLVDLFGWLNPQSLLINMPAVVLRDGELTIEELPGFENAPELEDDVWLLGGSLPASPRG
jgi:hypothetical protein